MEKKNSIFKTLKLYRVFKKTIKKNKLILSKDYGLRVDRSYRLYRVINLPVKKDIESPYNINKKDIDVFVESMIKDYANKTGSYLNSIGLSEMYDFYDIKEVEKNSYLLVIGFSIKNVNFRSDVFYKNIYYRLIPGLILTAIISCLIIFL